MSCVTRTVLVACLFLGLSGGFVGAAGEIPDAPENKKWTVDGDVATIVIDNRADIIPLLIDKSAAAGQTITVQTDAKFISLTTASMPKTHLTLTVAGGDGKAGDNEDGAKVTLVMTAGASPTLTFNGKPAAVKEAIQWAELYKAADKTVTLEILNATFAKVIFEPPAAPGTATTRPVAVAAGTELLHNVKPAKLQASVKTFSDSVSKKCPACGGTGKVSVTVQTGSHQSGAFSVHETEQQSKDCEVCHGTGQVHATAEVVHRTGDEVVRNMIGLDMTDPKAQDAVKLAYTALTDDVIGVHDCWTLFTKDTKSTLAVAHPRTGTVIVAEIHIDKVETDGKGRKFYRAKLPGVPGTFMVLSPPTAAEVGKGFFLFGGEIDESLAEEAGRPGNTYVRGGFLFKPSLNPEWKWWLKPKKP